MAIKTINGILKEDSTKTVEEFNTEIKNACNSAETLDITNDYIGLVFNLKDKRIDFIPSPSITASFGVEDTTIVSGGSSGPSETLIQSTMSVNGLINSIFEGVNIPTNNIAYVVGNHGIIDNNVRFGLIDSVLVEETHNDFIIVNNGISSNVYYNSVIGEEAIQTVINGYPQDYNSINLTLYPLSTKIENLLTQTYTDSIQFYALTGVMSRVEKGTNIFDLINEGEDFVVSYNGSTYSAFKKNNMSIDVLQARMILG